MRWFFKACLAATFTTLTMFGQMSQATSPGDVVIDPNTGNATITPVTQLIDELPSTPDMLVLISNWLKLVSLLPFDIQTNRSTTCELTPYHPLPDVTRVSDDVARTYAKFAGVGYCLQNNKVRDWTCLGHCSGGTENTQVLKLDTDSQTDIKYYVAINHRLRSIIVGIRGTLTPMNVLVDLSWVPLDYTDFPGAPNGAMVHAGFLIAGLRIGGAIRDQLLGLANTYPTYTIDFTGHSLGGAVAQVTALNFVARTPISPSRVRVLTYGAPRIGNDLFAAAISMAGFNAVTRVTFNNDLVPHIPFRNTFGHQFKHSAGEKYLSGWWLAEFIEKELGWLGWVAARIRDLAGFSPRITNCADSACEDANCSASRAPYLNMLMHLRAFDVTFGPWC
jgi:hypothetical protein